jgi:hypothetical protein
VWRDVLVVIGDGTLGVICSDNSVTIGDGGSITIGGGKNLDVDALRVGGDDSILGMGDLGTDDQCSSGDSGALAAGKGSNILRAGDDVILAAGGGILGMHSGGGPDYVYSSPALHTQGVVLRAAGWLSFDLRFDP